MPRVLTPPPARDLPVHGRPGDSFPVHRIYCVGRNYAEHAREMGDSGREPPFFFMKPADAVVPGREGAPVELDFPSLTADLHHEVELVVAIGTGGRDIPVARALEHVWGYAVGLDMTRRDLQAQMKQQGRPWSIAKGFDDSAPVGALVPAASASIGPDTPIELALNGERRQSGRLGDQIWGVPEVIAHLSAAWALAPGDLIFTGTPAGVGRVQPGDRLEARIAGLPALVVEYRAS